MSGCKVIAEISNNHNGDKDLCIRLVTEAIEAGAHAIKFQCYTPQELVLLRGDGPAPDPWGAQGWSMSDLYEKARTPMRWFPDLIRLCEAKGVEWGASVFGRLGLALMLRANPDFLKIAALDRDSNFSNLALEMGLLAGYPVLMSVRPGETYEIQKVDTTRFERQAELLWCPEGYPQDPAAFDGIDFRRYAGISFHGTRWAVPAWAAGAGARYVEVHVQLDDVPSELESDVSLTISSLVKVVEAANG